MQTVPKPAVRPGHVLVQAKMTGVCGTDVELLDGVLGYFESGLSTFPIIPGHEWVGVIAETCDEAKFPIGSKVVGEVSVGCHGAACHFCPTAYNRCVGRSETGIARRDGAFAEYMLFPASAIHILPGDVEFEMAVLTEPLAVACHAAEKAVLAAGSDVIIFGDGPIGLLLLQVCLAKGAQVCVVGASTFRLKEALRLGAYAVVNIVDVADVPAEIARISPVKRLPSVVFEASGAIQAVNTALRCAGLGGRVVLIGLTGGKIAQLDVDTCVLEEIEIVGVVSSLRHHWQAATAMLASGAISSIVSHRLPLCDYGRAIEMLRNSSKHDMLKVVIDQQ